MQQQKYTIYENLKMYAKLAALIFSSYGRISYLEKSV
jgi:hypothetical protein